MNLSLQNPRPYAPSTFGRSSVLLSRDGLTIASVTLPPHLKLAAHAHKLDQICVVLEGQYREETWAGSTVLRPGSVLSRRSGSLHENVVGDSEVEVLLVDIEPERARKLQVQLPERAAYFAPGTFDEIHREIAFEVQRSDPASRVALEALICLLAARSGRSSTLSQPVRPAWFVEAVDLIRSQYRQSLTVAEIAAAVKVHSVTLSASFRRHFGKSVHGYITDLRVAHARRALVNSACLISEVAQEAGFYDESHMGRVFRRRLGMSPGTLRRRA